MSRLLGLVALLVLSISTISPAVPNVRAEGFDPAPVSAAEGAIPVTTIADDPRCGPGFTSSALAGSSRFACFHSAADQMPEVPGPSTQAATAAPVCLGNGVNGPRIQLIYMYVEGQPDRTEEVVPRIRDQIIPRMEVVFRETSRLQGREIGMRLHMPGCELAVDTVMIDADNGAPDDVAFQYPRITNRLREAGYDSTDRKYLLWFDGGNAGQGGRGACGVAPQGYPPVLGGWWDSVPGFRDNPTPVNPSNVGWQAADGWETAVVFRYGTPILGTTPGEPECWGRGTVGADTELHELIHLLGAVNRSAPNWNGVDAHCIDHQDLMCQAAPGGKTLFVRCNTAIEQLDCGSDDYFNARPAPGSYLSTHWNVANSRFFGEALVYDDVPVEIPRP